MSPYHFFVVLLLLHFFHAGAQTANGLSLEEYQQAKAFTIKDLDNDTYVKFGNNALVLDRYESRKPYFITGDDGLKKRVDLYTLLRKADGSSLGTVIYYTNEKGKLYTACLPNNAADRAVWEKYFEDIHATDKQEPNYVLKLSYVLSKEFSFQTYKASLKGKEPDRAEAGTYGTDICFPGNGEVLMANGSKKKLAQVKPGDSVVTVDPQTKQSSIVKVNKLVEHKAKNYAITRLTLLSVKEQVSLVAFNVQIIHQVVEATPNHPILTKAGIKNMGAVVEGEEVYCQNEKTGQYDTFTVWNKTEGANGVQKVYNIDADGGATFIINNVMLMQKQQKQ